MFKYVLRRLIIFIPTLFAISLLTFIISTQTPGDPVHNLAFTSTPGSAGPDARKYEMNSYKKLRKLFGLDLPVFYFSVKQMSSPDTLDRILPVYHQNTLKRWLRQYGNWPQVINYYQTVNSLYSNISKQTGKTIETKNEWIRITGIANNLITLSDPETAKRQLHTIKQGFISLNAGPLLMQMIEQTESSFNSMVDNTSKWKNYVPSFRWYGVNNQYHIWLFGDGQKRKGIFKGDFGISYKSRRPVMEEISEAIGITLLLSLITIFLTYLIAIPLGILSAAKKDSAFDHGISAILFSFYSLPAFWTGTLMIIFLGGGDYLNWFPPYGLGNTEGLSFFEAAGIRIHHLILPIFCMVYPALAFLSRQARGGLTEIQNQDYMRTARAKGLSENKVIWLHGFRNALLPIITLFANVFPYAIAGSLIAEVVFSIPGMGKLSVDALFARNYPLVFSLVFIASFMTLTGYLISDILYALADPRIRFGKKAV